MTMWRRMHIQPVIGCASPPALSSAAGFAAGRRLLILASKIPSLPAMSGVTGALLSL